jgi:sirohydrochlorin ferrochelatase
MKAILLVAHGSRRPESNAEVVALAEQLREDASVKAEIIHAAFLDMAQPTIPEGIDACVREGASSITLLPYFLNSGRHVIRDIPAIVAQTMQRHPCVSLRIGPHLGESGLMKELLVRMIEALPDA